IIVDRRHYSAKAQLNTDLLGSAGQSGGDLGACLAREPRGVIETQCNSEISRGVELVCRLHDQARILVPAPTRLEADRLYGPLRTTVGSRVQRRRRVDWRDTRRVHTVTLGVMDIANPLDWDLLVLPDVLAAVAPSHLRPLSTLYRGQKMYGFLPAGKTLSAR